MYRHGNPNAATGKLVPGHGGQRRTTRAKCGPRNSEGGRKAKGSATRPSRGPKKSGRPAGACGAGMAQVALWCAGTNSREVNMRKIIIAATALAFLSATAFAQDKGAAPPPSGSGSMTKGDVSKGKMTKSKKSAKKPSSSTQVGTSSRPVPGAVPPEGSMHTIKDPSQYMRQ